MENESFNNKILTQIHSRQIKPRSRWVFTTEHWFFVTIIGIMTFIGSIAVAITLFILTDHDWFAVSYLNESLAIHIVKTIPYLWIVITGLIATLVTNNIRKISRGYRINPWKVVLWSLVASMSIGSAFYFAGFGDFLDSYLDRTIPSYRTVVPGNRNIWKYPEQGLLSGWVKDVTPSGFVVRDDRSQLWNVTVTQATKSALLIKNGRHVKIIGEMTGPKDFTATQVFPWKNERK